MQEASKWDLFDGFGINKRAPKGPPKGASDNDLDYAIDCSAVEPLYPDCEKRNTCAIYPASETPIMNGAQLPAGIRETGFISLSESGRPVWTLELVEHMIANITGGGDMSPGDYPGAQADLMMALEHVAVRGKHVFVAGSMPPGS